MFTNAYPESIPTIPARRAIHTGRRAFPFKSYKSLKWDVVSLPGWQPLSNNENPETVKKEVKRIISILNSNGGYILAPGYNI